MTTSKTKRVVLLDSHAIIHRAYHALPDFTSSKGEPTGALYGLVSMLLKLSEELSPDYILACFDLPEPTYRHEAYEHYKAGRAKTDDALSQQLDRARDVFEAFSIPIYEKKGYEADDLIGTLSEVLKKEKNTEVIIASGDMDTLQLVDKKKVRVYTLKKGIKDTILYDEKAVTERFGFKPELLKDYKGLRGDPSDNIIGIAGIGEKTATTLIEAFGTIEKMYAALHKNEGVFKEKAGVSERIVNLLKEGEEEALFSKELATIHLNVPVKISLPKKEWKESVDLQKVTSLFEELNFRTLKQRVRVYFGAAEEVMPEQVSILVDEESVVAQEAKVLLWLLDSDITNPKASDVLQYTKEDTVENAHKKLLTELKKEKRDDLYIKMEKPLISVVDRMNNTGVAIDVPYLKKLSGEYHKELSSLEKKIHKHAGEEFNINSPKQLATILFDKLELKVSYQKKTSTGQKSTKESELEKMKDLHPIINDILSYRELQKLLSTYIDNIPGMVAKDGRLRAQFLQTGTTTGRMSSQNPNLQNIPIRSELGRRIRDAFVAEKGYVLAALDYSQIELRLAAILSDDKELITAFKEGKDIHTTTAAFVFDIPPEMVDKEMRRQAKIINFGILYGMGVNALKTNLGTDRATAQNFLNEYFKNYHGLAEYMESIKGEVRRRGYTETLFGRKRSFAGISSPIPYIRAAAERMAINAPIQGTEADLIKLAMVRVDEYIKKERLEKEVRLLLQVHDELVYEVKKGKEEVLTEIKEIMEGVLPKKETKGVPILVDVSTGINWGNMERL